MELESLTEQIIVAAIEVHKELGAGLLESSYERCLCHELSLRGIPYVCELQLPVNYKGMQRFGGWKVGLLINFNVAVLKDGIKRRVLNAKD